MATVGLATAIAQGRGGEHMEAGRKRFLLTYLVKTDSPLDGPHAVLSCGGLPSMRDPYAAAKAIGTAAYLSDGRVELGIGVGWCEEEFSLMGQRFDRRGKRHAPSMERGCCGTLRLNTTHTASTATTTR